MKTKTSQHILRFIIAYHKKEQAHAEKRQPRRFLLSKHPLHIIHNRLSIHTTPTPTQRQLSTHLTGYSVAAVIAAASHVLLSALTPSTARYSISHFLIFRSASS